MPRCVLITYSDYNFSVARQQLIATAGQIGKIDEVYAFDPKDIDRLFYRANRSIFYYRRGAGYWLWKPYFIRRVLGLLSDQDILLYSDASGVFMESASELVATFARSEGATMAFELIGLKEKSYTKRDCLIALGCDTSKYTESDQFAANFSLWKPLPDAFTFLDAWLAYATQPHLLTDSPSQSLNYQGFIEHRHDQSLFSLLYRKYALPAVGDLYTPLKPVSQQDPSWHYGGIIHFTRARNRPPHSSLVRHITSFLRRNKIPYRFLSNIVGYFEQRYRSMRPYKNK